MASRAGVELTLVANQSLRTPASRHIKSVQVSSGFDVADSEIVKQVAAGDLVITADIPLAAQVVEKGAHALNPRGELYTPENIKSRLSLRDFMTHLRDSGMHTGGPAPLSLSDRQAFANHLDRLLVKSSKQS